MSRVKVHPEPEQGTDAEVARTRFPGVKQDGKDNKFNEEQLLELLKSQGENDNNLNDEQLLGRLKALVLKKDNPEILSFKDRKERTPLHLAARYGQIRFVEKLIELNKKLLNVKDSSGRTALQDAVEHVKIAEILLENGAEVDNTDEKGRTPLSYAAEKGLLESTELLISKGANINLECSKKKRPIHYAAEKGHTKVFCVLLEKTDEKELEHTRRKCFNLAIEENHVETVLALLHIADSSTSPVHWKTMLRSRSKHKKYNRTFDTPMRKLIRQMPDVAREVFDKCTEISDKEQFSVTFDYEFLDDTYHLGKWKVIDEESGKESKESSKEQVQDGNKNKPGGHAETQPSNEQLKDANKNDPGDSTGEPYTDTTFIKMNHPLMIIVKSGQTQLLDHPLISALLRQKWTSIGLKLSFFNFILYAVFLLMLTGFAIDVQAPYLFKNVSAYSDIDCSDFTNDSIPKFASNAKWGVIVVASIELLIELIEMWQMYSCKFWKYFLEMENLSEWITCCTAIIFVIDTNRCESDVGYRPPVQWICGTVSVFCAWINMLFLLRKFDWFGIYVVMLYRIIKMFTKFFLVFSLLIVAFAISFHCLFQNQQQFSTVWISLMRTTSMMIGGPDFVATFLDETVHYERTSYAFFFGFMLLMAIVVLNLLVGLAVSNIQEFQKKADISKKRMQVIFALELERIATSRIFLKQLVKKFRKKTEQTEKLVPKDWSWLEKKFAESWKLTERHIKAAMKTERDDNNSRLLARLDSRITDLDTKLSSILDKIDSNSGKGKGKMFI